jgi:hypothetical protein
MGEGGGSMHGSKKSPSSEAVEASKPDRRNEKSTAPPSALPPRRDDRVEPDDDASSSRVEVVNVDGGSRDVAASGMGSLKRELAKLHQQAAAVEKSLEDQRRDRSDALDRLERATERVTFLEARHSAFEAETALLKRTIGGSLAELQTVRDERDDLARAVAAAKISVADAGKLREEIRQLRESAVQARDADAELAKAREESSRAVEAAAQAKAEAAKAQELSSTGKPRMTAAWVARLSPVEMVKSSAMRLAVPPTRSTRTAAVA